MSSRIGKIQSAWTATGSTLYAIVRNAIAEAWNVGGAVFEAFNVANWSQYAVPMTEQGALSQFYVADIPAGAEAYYTIAVYEQAGVGPAVADTLVDTIRAPQLADDVPHGGPPATSTATLALMQIRVDNPSSTAVIIRAVGGGDALAITADSPGFAMSLTGSLTVEAGTDQSAIIITGDAFGTHPATVYLRGASAAGPAIVIDGGGDYSVGDAAMNQGQGMLALGNPGEAITIQAGPNSHAVHIIGGSTAGDGILIESLNNGVEITAAGAGIAIVSDGTGISVQSNTDASLFLGANLLPPVVITANAGNAVEVNAVQSVDGFGRHRILSSLTSGFDLLAFPFIMTDLAGNPKTGLTVTSTVSRDGAAAVPTTNAPTEVGNGQYSIDLTASDRAATTMMLRFTAPNARDLDIALINTA